MVLTCIWSPCVFHESAWLRLCAVTFFVGVYPSGVVLCVAVTLRVSGFFWAGGFVGACFR
jgi:hypothetical protein